MPDSRGFRVRPARTNDVPGIRALVDTYAPDRRLLSKATVALYESIPEFLVAEAVSTGPGAPTAGVAGRRDREDPATATSGSPNVPETSSDDLRTSGAVIGCGAVHVMWDDLAEVRTLAVEPSACGKGVGTALLRALLDRAQQLGVRRVFVLTFETAFFGRSGFVEIAGTPVDHEVFEQLLRSYDEGVAEFLDLERVKPNTLGNHRMLLQLPVKAAPG